MINEDKTNEQIDIIQQNSEENVEKIKEKLDKQELDIENDVIGSSFNFEYFNKEDVNRTFRNKLYQNFEVYSNKDSSLRPIRLATSEISDVYNLESIHTSIDSFIDAIIDNNSDTVIVIEKMTPELLTNLLNAIRSLMQRQIIIYTDDDFKKHVPFNDFKNIIILQVEG